MSMADILTIGEILTEFVAEKIGQSFEQTGVFAGPYPSGAPAIFIDQAAKTGSSARIVSKIGPDGFGTLNLERLRRDGVDVSRITTVPDKTTGIAFVTYLEDGGRSFIFTTKDSASAAIGREDVTEDLFAEARYFHIAGCSIFSSEMIEVFRKAIGLALQHGVNISFDPNIRREVMDSGDIRDFVRYVVESCTIFLPGEDELQWITGIADERRAAEVVLGHRAEYIIVKRGSRGSRVYGRDGVRFPVTEIDPTGAGDCFAGTLVSLLNQGRTLDEALRYASAAGAYCVTRRGPMEGTATLPELEAFMNSRAGHDGTC
jgi:sugar/nucleoside kinase (ribokinase family)